MWIVTGLGNPGTKYTRTRHNVGFKVIDHLAETYGMTLEEKEQYRLGRGTIDGQRVVLLEPLTFMNRSGTAVKRVLKRAAFSSDNRGDALIVVHDDLDLETGVVKIRKGGSSGGHRGIESIMQETGTRDFIRVKVGIGRDRAVPVEKYVLGSFSPAESRLIKDAIIRAAEAVAVIVTEGIDTAMNRYNRPAQPGKARL